ncbi:MAG TPA: hypothetical protein VGM19_13430 [Armatimonadota bacterium]|jgi:hypothetical protein
MNGRGQRLRWTEAVLVFLLVTGVCLRAGYLSAARAQVNWEGLAAVAHAADLWYKAPEARLTEIGFVQPPLPALLASLAVLGNPHGAAALARPVWVGAPLLGLAAVLLLGLALHGGAPRWWAYPVTALFALNTVTFSLAAAGSPALLLIVLLLGTAWCLDRWAATGALRPLLIASVLVGAAMLTRYEMVFWVLLLAGLVAVVAYRAGGYSRLEGTLLAFLLPGCYLLAGWVVACWLIQGDPWYFWRHTFSGPPSGEPLLGASVYLALLACPLLLAVGVWLARRSRARAALASLTLLFGSIALAGLLQPLLGRLAGDAWSQLTVPVAAAMAAGYLLATRLLTGGERRSDRALVLLLALLAILLVGVATRLGGGLPRWPAQTWQGELAFTDTCQSEVAAAQSLRTELRPGERVLIVGWPGFAVSLVAGEGARVTVIPGPGDRALAEVAEPYAVVLAGWPADQPTPLPLSRYELRWRSGDWACFRASPGG